MRTWIVLGLVTLGIAGCVHTTTRDCNGQICPETQVCSPMHDGTCVNQDQIDQCSNGQTTCSLPGVSAACYPPGVCLPFGCGNGIMDPGEVCDDGNTIANDGCSATCDSDEKCGNGHVDTKVPNPEGCDCGDASFTGERPPGCNGMPNSDAPDAVCTTTCQLRGCGDGIKNGLEDCDGTDIPKACTDVGYYGGTLACLPTCKFDVSACTGTCGDGAIDGPAGREKCDGADLAGKDCTSFGLYFPAGLACTAACTFDVSGCTGRCGDGVYDAGHEACDSSETSAQLAMRGLDCRDFGFYQTAGLTCNAACQFDTTACTQFCGDGAKNGPEQCEPGVLGGKTCADFGFYAGTLGCRADSCTYDTSACAQRCGDGAINGPEQCDGAQLAGKTCSTFGFYNAPGLKCSAACGFDTSACTGGRCGDGVRQVAEDCDTNDLDNLDCTDFGFYASAGLACDGGCGFDTSACKQYCGDRALQPSHEICEGQLPGAQLDSCVEFGYESGDLGCSSGCGWDFTACTADRPATLTLTGVTSARTAAWSASPNDVWITGSLPGQSGPQFAHWNGTSWSTTTLAGSANFGAMWGTSSTNIFAVGVQGVGLGAIAHYNGTWSAQTLPAGSHQLRGVWGSSATDVWAVGDQNTAYHTTDGGTTWVAVTISTTSTPSWRAISGTSSSDIWVVGNLNAVYHWQGTKWISVPPIGPSTQTFNGVLAASFNDIDIVGDSGTIFHGDGTTWTAIASPVGKDLTAISGTPASRFIVGDTNTLIHSDGVHYTEVPIGTSLVDLTNVWVASPNAIYLIASGGGAGGSAMLYDGARFFRMHAAANVAMSGLFGFSDTNMFAGDANGLEHFDGNAWGSVTGVPTNAVWGATAGFEYAVGGSVTAQIDQDLGGGWFPMSVPANQGVLRAVWGSASNNVYAVGDTFGTAVAFLHYTGSGGSGSWTTVPSNNATKSLYAIYGFSASDIYTGGAADFLHWNGGTWSPISLPATSSIHAIWGSSPTDIWAGGDLLFHFDGNAWKQVPIPTPTLGVNQFAVRAIAGTGPSDVFVSGDGGGVLHFDGYAWSPMDTGGAGTLGSGFVTPGGDVFFSGAAGTMLRRPRTCTATETSCGDGKDDDCDGRIDCDDPDCAAACTGGGTCADAVLATSVATCTAGKLVISGTTGGGTTAQVRYGCDPTFENGPRRVYAYTTTAGASGAMTATLDTQGRDLDLIVMGKGGGGACEPRADGCIAASSSIASTETATFAVAPNTTYYFAVETYASDAGNFTLTIPCL